MSMRELLLTVAALLVLRCDCFARRWAWGRSGSVRSRILSSVRSSSSSSSNKSKSRSRSSSSGDGGRRTCSSSRWSCQSSSTVASLAPLFAATTDPDVSRDYVRRKYAEPPRPPVSNSRALNLPHLTRRDKQMLADGERIQIQYREGRSGRGLVVLDVPASPDTVFRTLSLFERYVLPRVSVHRMYRHVLNTHPTTPQIRLIDPYGTGCKNLQ